MKFSWIAVLLAFLGINETKQNGGDKYVTEDQAKADMMLGKLGTTIIETGMREHLIVKNGEYFTCSSMVVERGKVKCNGKFKKLEIVEPSDYCFAQRYSMWENNDDKKLCIPSDNQATVFNMHDNVQCSSSVNSDTPTLFVSQTEYMRTCKMKPDEERLYTFYPDHVKHTPHIKRPKTVKCEKLSCSFREKLRTDNVVASTFSRRKNKVEI